MGVLWAGKRTKKLQIPTKRRKWFLMICFHETQRDDVHGGEQERNGLAERCAASEAGTSPSFRRSGVVARKPSPVPPQRPTWWLSRQSPRLGGLTNTPSDAVTTASGACPSGDGLGETSVVPSCTYGGTKALSGPLVCIYRNSGGEFPEDWKRQS